MNKSLNVKISIIDKNYREEYIDYTKFNGTDNVFLDETNFEKFFKINALCFSYDTYDKEYSLKSYSLKFEPEPLSPQKIEDIKDRMIENLGSCDIALGFDNDTAGLKYKVIADYLRSDLGIEVFDSIPENIKKETDLNDVLKVYKELKEKAPEKAEELLEKHIQKIEPEYELKKKANNKQDLQNGKRILRKP